MEKQNRRHRPADIANWRQRLGLTQKDLADQIGLNQATISDIEKGKNKNAVTIALVLSTLMQIEDRLEPQPRMFNWEAMVLAASAGLLVGASIVASVSTLLT